MITRKIGRTFLTFLNKLLPKKDQIIIVGFPNTESGAIQVANSLAKGYKTPVFFVRSSETNDDPAPFLSPKTRILVKRSRYDLDFIFRLMTSKYIFFTHGIFLNSFSSRQVVVNLWHGILYKKVGALLGGSGIGANITVGTSPLTQEMFAKAFRVSRDTVTTTGYPRNDKMLEAKRNKKKIQKEISPEFLKYQKIIIWLPTFRRSVRGEIRKDGKEAGNPFYIENFDVEQFNKILRLHNTLCLVKPHPMAPPFPTIQDLENLIFIDDKWIVDRKITLYDLVGVTDLLISDVSSVVIDYLLMDQPIICISTDLQEYKNSRGFYFSNIENWLPFLVQNRDDLFYHLGLYLANETDLDNTKREFLKNQFFQYHDSYSTERLLKKVFE